MFRNNTAKNKNIKIIPPENKRTMRGAGLSHKNKKFITHTTLPVWESAYYTINGSQFIILSLLIVLLGLAYMFDPLQEIRVIVTIISAFYFTDTMFNLFLVMKSLKKPVEVSFNEKQLSALNSKNLPVYSILCPLYKEARIIPQFLRSITRLDWPHDKLDVLLLLEEDDKESIKIVSKMNLPPFCRVIVVPDSQPKTKPKACNYGLSYARGEYLVIYDAEDIPDPMQLKKAYLGFKTLPQDIRCLQAKLNYYNPGQNILTRLFTAEYSLWFDLMLTGLQSLNSAIPLGGTSNHFKTADLKGLLGWDPFNVTEDADLGIRLFKKGYRTAIIDSTTLEEANSRVGNWFRQRSRWIKGYIQTYLVHTRNMSQFIKTHGIKHAFIFHLTIGGKILFLFINPIMWVITFTYFAFYEQSSALIESVFYPPVSYFAVISWIFGNFLFVYYYMIACNKLKQWDLVKYIFLIPVYWAMMSVSASIALYQLFFKPHYWEKTVHGLHLNRKHHVVAISKGKEVTVFSRENSILTMPKFAPEMRKL